MRGRVVLAIALAGVTGFIACDRNEERDPPTSNIPPGAGPGPAGTPGSGGGGGAGGEGGAGGMAGMGGIGGAGSECDLSGNCAACASCAHSFECNGVWIDCNNDPDCLASIGCLQLCNQSCADDDDCYLDCRSACQAEPGFGQAVGYLSCLCNLACPTDCSLHQTRDCILFVQ